MTYIVALAGNPNCGKTTLFNELTGSKQHVGNWPGVTVDKKEGFYKKNQEIQLLDLPGTYSLSPYSAEEIISRNYIVKEKPDAVINIVDGTSMERNLYLTVQIAETQIPMVVAVNMMDEVVAKGDRIDCERLSEKLKVPVVPITARSGKGLDLLMQKVLEVIQNKEEMMKFSVLDQPLEAAQEELSAILSTGSKLEDDWMALKLLEGDEIIENSLKESQKEVAVSVIGKAEEHANGDIEARIADLRYQFIEDAVKYSVKKMKTGYTETKSDHIDKVLTNRFLALPMFVLIMYILFACTFSENFLFVPDLPSPGIFLSGLVEEGWAFLTTSLEGLLFSAGVSDWVFSLVIDGVMASIGAVAGFLPLILVLFLLLSFLEDSGYMARIAFVMDRLFRHFGLSGRSVIPLLMGFGCSVPALMASRTLEQEKDRKITMMITPFMSCGAKLPIYALFAGTLFAGSNQTILVFSIYLLGLFVAILSAFLLNKFAFKEKTSNFIMELPQYRIPTLKSVLIHAWEKIKDFAVKAGTVIFISSILIWFLSNFNFSGMCDMEDSFLASIGNAISFVFVPLGFGDWRASVGVVTGWIAKENVVTTFAQLFGDLGEVFTKATAFGYMAFNLLCMPCFAAVGAMRKEMGSWKWTLKAIGFQMGVAYLVALVIRLVGMIGS